MRLQWWRRRVPPPTYLALGLLGAIGVGGALLRLPVAHAGATVGWIDALFTATSAVCVTGPTTVDTGTRHYAIRPGGHPRPDPARRARHHDHRHRGAGGARPAVDGYRRSCASRCAATPATRRPSAPATCSAPSCSPPCIELAGAALVLLLAFAREMLPPGMCGWPSSTASRPSATPA
ncbi:MAG: hypothetical protein U0802_08350 [Candidatus Binatia bacterium]